MDYIGCAERELTDFNDLKGRQNLLLSELDSEILSLSSFTDRLIGSIPSDGVKPGVDNNSTGSLLSELTLNNERLDASVRFLRSLIQRLESAL